MEPELPPHPELPSASAIPPLTPIAPPALQAPPLRDRSTGLSIFGVVQIILGLLAALMIPLVMLGVFLSHVGPGGGMHLRHMISGVATYAFIATGLLTLGIGSIQAKRWARALTLVTSWYWLISGVLITVLLTAVLPVMTKSVLAQAQQANPSAPQGFSTGIMAVILTLMIVFAAIFLIVIPIGFVVFYGRQDVAETCRRRDPKERWTDRAPLPVLGASVVLSIAALYMVVVGLSTPLFPFFGRYLTGAPGAVCFILLATLDFYLAVALFRLQPSGWWLAFITLAIRLVSITLTYARADLMQAYSKLGFSDAQLRIMNSNPMIRSHVILWWSLFSMVGLFAYLVWIKRYFKAPTSPIPAEPLPAQAI